MKSLEQMTDAEKSALAAKDLSWNPERDEEAATETTPMGLQPVWIVERAYRLMLRTDATFEQALDITLQFVQADRNATCATDDDLPFSDQNSIVFGL